MADSWPRNMHDQSWTCHVCHVSYCISVFTSWLLCVPKKLWGSGWAIQASTALRMHSAEDEVSQVAQDSAQAQHVCDWAMKNMKMCTYDLRRTAHQWVLMDWVSALWLSRIYDLHWLLKSPSLAAGSVVAAGVDPQKCQVEHASPASCNARLNDSAQIRRKNLNSAECVTQQSWVIWRHFFLSFICLWFKLILHLESLVFHSLCPQVGDSITLADISAWSLPGLPHFWRLLAESRNCIAT